MASNNESYSCSIEPNSYKYFPRFSLAKSVGSTLNSNFNFSIESVDKIGNKRIITAEKVRYGEAYHITDDNGTFELLKSQSIY